MLGFWGALIVLLGSVLLWFGVVLIVLVVMF